MRTTFDTLIDLSKFTINHLKQGEYIQFTPEDRAALIDALATELNVAFSTDEDIKDQAIEEVEDKFGTDLPDDITETEMFNHARKEIIKSYNGETLSGLYLVESLRNVAYRVKDFLLNSDLIEDVYGSDEEIVNFTVDKMRRFSTKSNQ